VHDPQQRAFDLAAGDAKRVALRVVVTPEKADPNDAAAPSVAASLPAGGANSGDGSEDAGANARSTRRLIGWVAIGAGGAALVGAGISLALRQSALSDLNGACGTGATLHCPTNRQDLQSTANSGSTATTLFDVLGAVGLVGVAGGIVLLTTARDPEPVHAGLVVTPTLGGASATWRW
jgi:hypothetical protein